jgi:AraC-like DNA-binding protein
MASVALVSTQDVRARHGLDLWGQNICQLFGQLRSETFGDKSFVGKLEHCQLGDIRVCRLNASRHRVVRTSTFAKQDDRGFLKVVLQKKGTSYFEQGGRSVLLSPGEWSIYDTARSYTVSSPRSVEQLVLMVPREKILTGGLDLSYLIVRRFLGNAGISRLTYQFITTIFDEMAMISLDAACGISDTIAELIRLALLGHSVDQNMERTAPLRRHAQRDRIHGYICSHLRDPELSIAHIAAAINCTKRYVHKIFQTDATTVSDQIWRMRLARCREDLCNPAYAGRSITDIAFSWGFNSSAHFSRTFKQEFGVCPRYLRKSLGSRGLPADATSSKSQPPRNVQPLLHRSRVAKEDWSQH